MPAHTNTPVTSNVDTSMIWGQEFGRNGHSWILTIGVSLAGMTKVNIFDFVHPNIEVFLIIVLYCHFNF